MELSRRRFLQVTTATSAALALGPSRWGWAIPDSPFGPLQDDPLLRLPEGFSYKVIAQTGDLLTGGRGPATRPQFPDLNVTFKQNNGKILLSTSHEVPAEFPAGQPPPQEEYDQLTAGAITSLLLNPDLSIAESAYNAGGMVSNCSGGRTPWGNVLTGEEATNTLEADHGFIWEVDPHRHTKIRLDDCGRFEHEAALIDPKTGFVYLTEDSGGDSLLYRMRPKSRRHLGKGGILEAYKPPGRWVRIEDPLGEDGVEPAAQGVKKGALKFSRLEGTARWGRWLYFAETEDDTACGKVWRLHLDRGRLELWAQGSAKGRMCMPDNLVFDAAGNIFVTEDKGEASSENQNKILFIDKGSGKISVFGKLAAPQAPQFADEPTGPAFDPQKRVLFLNLQRADGTGRTLAINGPFAKASQRASGAAIAPPSAQPEEALVLRSEDKTLASLELTTGEAAGMLSLFRRGRVEELPRELLEIATDLGRPGEVPTPRRRIPRIF